MIATSILAGIPVFGSASRLRRKEERQMGMFNTVVAEAACPWCHQIGSYRIQFHYGEPGLHEYELGEALKWSGKSSDVGRKDAHHVLVLGLGHACSHCQSNEEDNGIEFCILIEENILTSVFPLHDLWSDDYLILDEIRDKHLRSPHSFLG